MKEKLTSTNITAINITRNCRNRLRNLKLLSEVPYESWNDLINDLVDEVAKIHNLDV